MPAADLERFTALVTASAAKVGITTDELAKDPSNGPTTSQGAARYEIDGPKDRFAALPKDIVSSLEQAGWARQPGADVTTGITFRRGSWQAWLATADSDPGMTRALGFTALNVQVGVHSDDKGC